MYVKVANELGYFKNSYCKPNTDLTSETLKASKTGHVFGFRCMNPTLPSTSIILTDQQDPCSNIV